MKFERRQALERSATLNLTPEEIAEGWIFCICEWDDMLIHKDDPEAQFCHCLEKRLERLN